MGRRRNHIAVCNYVMGKSREDRVRLFSEVHSNRTRGNRDVLEHGKFQLLKIFTYLNHGGGQTLDQGPKEVENLYILKMFNT